MASFPCGTGAHPAEGKAYRAWVKAQNVLGRDVVRDARRGRGALPLADVAVGECGQWYVFAGRTRHDFSF
ncbi:hypothetical protein GCM10022402_04850 [Salinactinospora qingdaonensis]|uniref:Uncharacterized protein n=1 Tax=Salinactinospora qingdaonensis TaxID=702744 RepID=A0ABP7EY66_9ACTN